MRNRWHVILVVLVILIGAACTRQARATLEREWPQVWHRPGGQSEREVEKSTTASKDDRVWTQQKGRALLKWPDLWVRLYDDTNLVMEEVTPTDVRLSVDAGTALNGGVRRADQRIALTTAYAEITFAGTTIMVAYHPGRQLTLVRVFDGQAEVRNLTGEVRTELVSAREWALVEPGVPPRVSDRLEEMRDLARELGLWDVFHEVELDVQRGFGPGASRVAPGDVDIVFLPEATPVTPMPSPTRTPTRTPPPTRTPYVKPCRLGVLYCEDFEDGRADGWDLGPGWRVMRDGANHVLEGKSHNWATLVSQGWEWEDYRFRFRLKLLQGGIHLNYRLTEGPIRYFIGFHQGGLYLSRQVRDKFTDLARVEALHLLGRWYQVEIVGWGGHLQVYVDGKLELDYTDKNPLRRGTIAFETLDDSRAQVDDIEVTASGPEPVRVSPTDTPRPPTRVPPTATPKLPTPIPPTDTPRPPTPIPPTEAPRAPTMRFWPDRDCIMPGQCTVLRWEVENVTAVYFDGEGVVGHDARQVCPDRTTTYRLRAVSPAGDIEQTVMIKVPKVSFWVDRDTIQQGECTTLRWDVEGAQAVHLDGQGVAGHDSRQVCPAQTTSYTLHVVTDCGDVDRSVTVTVLPRVPTDRQGPAIGELVTTPAGDRFCEYLAQLTISSVITDPSGVDRAELWYLYIPFGGVGVWESVPMSREGDTFYATIGGFGVGELRYHIKTWDSLGNESESPKGVKQVVIC